VVVSFVYIGRIFGHHCLNLLFIINHGKMSINHWFP